MNVFLKTRIFPFIIYVTYRIYTSFVKYIEPEFPPELKKWVDEGNPYIVAHFHQDEIALIQRRRNSNFCVMTSTSTDGEMMTRFLKLMGYHCFRGSSTRGGAEALIGLIRFLKKNRYSADMAVDGPRGPIYKVKKGTIMLAKKTGFPILPVRVAINRSYCFEKSWNRALLPLPFSTVKLGYGKVLWISDNTDDANIEEYRALLEKELLNIKGTL